MNKRKLLLQFIDLVIMVCIMTSLALVFPSVGSVSFDGRDIALKIGALALCFMLSRYIFRIYSNVWRYSNVRLYVRIMIADTVGCAAFVIFCGAFPHFSVGFAYIGISLCTVLLVTLLSRFIYQILHAHFNAKKEGVPNLTDKINIAIIGAGNIGSALADEFIRNPLSKYTPCCFIDRDLAKVGNSIRGLKIYAENADTIKQLGKMNIQEVVIAIPDGSAEIKSELYTTYSTAGYRVKLYDYLGGESSPDAKRTLREFDIEDLLFRNTIQINNELTSHFYSDKIILVTGGGGSIGSELCRQIAKQHPKKLVIFDIYENNAYEIQQELRRKYGASLNLEVLIGSVRDVDRLDMVFEKVRPEIVIHAAAHKHVPLMEDSPAEAIKNNVVGTYNTANAAEKYGVAKFLLISTDKAVNPTNIMGASKRLCEMVIQCRVDSKTEFTAVRFGNVLGSNGSVIPLFRQQISAGGPITLTDKRIIRYFMTIPEAAQLVLEAGAMAKNGELFVLDMGKPVKILELAENMIRLSGLRPYEDIDIVEVGLRPGEKLYEELLIKGEDMTKTDNELIFIERDKAYTREEIKEKIDLLLASEAGGREKIFEAFHKTVPTYKDAVSV